MADAALHEKYLRWASYEITRRIVALELEEVYRLAQELLAAPPPTEAGRHEAHPVAGDEPPAGFSYPAAVAILTDHFRHGLPEFDHWAAAYRSDPHAYDAEIAGL